MKKSFFLSSLLFSFLFMGFYSPNVFSQTGISSGNIGKPTTVKSVGKLSGVNGFFVHYSDNLFRGGKITSEEAITTLVEKGITVIISAEKNSELKSFAKKNGLKYYCIPVKPESGFTAKTIKKFTKATQVGSEVYFFTCERGKHRAGIFCAMYRMKFADWSYSEAMREFIKLGGDPVADKVYMQSVKTLMK